MDREGQDKINPNGLFDSMVHEAYNSRNMMETGSNFLRQNLADLEIYSAVRVLKSVGLTLDDRGNPILEHPDVIRWESGFIQEAQNAWLARIDELPSPVQDESGFIPVVLNPLLGWCVLERAEPTGSFRVVTRIAPDGSHSFVGMGPRGTMETGICSSLRPDSHYAPQVNEPRGCLGTFLFGSRRTRGYDQTAWDEYANANPISATLDAQLITEIKHRLFTEWVDRDVAWINLYRTEPETALRNWVRWCYVQNTFGN